MLVCTSGFLMVFSQPIDAYSLHTLCINRLQRDGVLPGDKSKSNRIRVVWGQGRRNIKHVV